MLIPFLVVGGIGLLLLIVSLVLGDVLDHLDLDAGALSGTALAVGMVVFGAAGAFTSTTNLDTVWTYVIAGVVAVIAYVLSVMVIRSLTRSSDGVPASAVGLTGVTTSSVSPSGGEVRLDGPGELERRLAFADTDIAEGVRVRVIEQAGSRVRVVTD